MSHSSAEVTWRPVGPGNRARTARVDLSRIPDPEAWLTNRLGPLARFEMRRCEAITPHDAAAPSNAERLDALSFRLTASMPAVLATRRAALDAIAARLEAAAPVAPRRSAIPASTEETRA